MRDRFYSTADLSRVCGVSISTIKRWTDAGILRCIRTPGGHRKYRVQDVAEAARRLGLVCADADAPAAARVDELALLLLQGNRDALAAQLAEALRAGDPASVRGMLLDLHRHGMRLVDAALLVRDALARLEAQPAGGADLDAFVRGRATALASATLRQLVEPRTAPEAPLALLASHPSADGDLDSCLVLIALVENGWRAVDLGRLPEPAALRGGLRAERPELVVYVGGAPGTEPAPGLEEDVAAHGAELFVVAAADEAALGALRARTANRERRAVAALV